MSSPDLRYVEHKGGSELISISFPAGGLEVKGAKSVSVSGGATVVRPEPAPKDVSASVSAPVANPRVPRRGEGWFTTERAKADPVGYEIFLRPEKWAAEFRRSHLGPSLDDPDFDPAFIPTYSPAECELLIQQTLTACCRGSRSLLASAHVAFQNERFKSEGAPVIREFVAERKAARDERLSRLRPGRRGGNVTAAATPVLSEEQLREQALTAFFSAASELSE